MADTGFAGAQDANAEQQRALLAAIAENGAAGAQAYKAAQDQNQQLQQAALARAGGTQPVVGNALDVNAAALANAQASFQGDIARQGANNATYFGKLGAAIPIVEQNTKLGVEQILAQRQAEQEQRAMQLEQSRLSLQGQRESISANREDHAYDLAVKAANNGITPYQAAQIKLAEADNNRADRQYSEAQAAKAQAAREAKQGAALDALNRSTGQVSVDKKGKETIVPTHAVQAISDIVNGYLTVDQALARYHTPAGKPLDRNYIQSQVDAILAIR